MVVLSDCVNTSDRCNDVLISLNLERDFVQGEVRFFRWSAKWLGLVRVANIEMAIGLVQWFSFAAMLSPYFKSFEGSDFKQQIE